jgi:hypothetical protein
LKKLIFTLANFWSFNLSIIKQRWRAWQLAKQMIHQDMKLNLQGVECAADANRSEAHSRTLIIDYCIKVGPEITKMGLDGKFGTGDDKWDRASDAVRDTASVDMKTAVDEASSILSMPYDRAREIFASACAGRGVVNPPELHHFLSSVVGATLQMPTVFGRPDFSVPTVGHCFDVELLKAAVPLEYREENSDECSSVSAGHAKTSSTMYTVLSRTPDFTALLPQSIISVVAPPPHHPVQENSNMRSEKSSAPSTFGAKSNVTDDISPDDSASMVHTNKGLRWNVEPAAPAATSASASATGTQHARAVAFAHKQQQRKTDDSRRPSNMKTVFGAASQIQS